MIQREKLLARLRRNPQNVRWIDLVTVCRQHFGEPVRQRGSHLMFELPWPDDPLLNIQRRGKMAKPAQVRDALRVIGRLLEESDV